MRRFVFVLATIATGLTPVVDGCRAPTQVTLDIRTRATCSDVHGTDIIVAAEPNEAQRRLEPRVPTTSTSQCAGDGIGTLVVTPSGDRGAVVIVAGFGAKRAEQCTAADNWASCIIARRRFAFIERTSVTLPILLDPDCAGIPCGATETCLGKRCVDSEVVCDESGGCSGLGELPDGGGPSPSVDGSPGVVDADATSDTTTREDGEAGDASVDGGDGSVASPGTSACGTSLKCPLSGVATTCAQGNATCCHPGGMATCTDVAACTAYPKACCAGSDQCLNGNLCCNMGGNGATFTGTTNIVCAPVLACGQSGGIHVCRTASAGASPECPAFKSQCGPGALGPYFVCQ